MVNVINFNRLLDIRRNKQEELPLSLVMQMQKYISVLNVLNQVVINHLEVHTQIKHIANGATHLWNYSDTYHL